MMNNQARAAWAALLLSLPPVLVHGTEPAPFSLDGLRAADVQASGEQVPAPAPVPLAVSSPSSLILKGKSRRQALDARGKPICVKGDSFDYSRSSDYQSWLAFFRDGAEAPQDLDGDWNLVGTALFTYSLREACLLRGGEPDRCKRCLDLEVVANPEGLGSRTEWEGADDAHKERLSFAGKTVSVTGWCYGNCRDANESFGPPQEYAQGADFVEFGKFPMNRKCRLLKGDGSRLICAETPWRCHSVGGASTCEIPAGSSEFQVFLIYARDEGRGPLAPMGNLLKAFVPQAPEPPRLIRRPPRD